MITSSDQNDMKRAAAYKAVEAVEDGMVIGLGTGSTATFVVEALGARIARGLQVTTISSSERTAALAKRLSVPGTTFAEHRCIDITIDGADQLERGTLNLVKGLGGALLREKIVASASRRMIVVADETKVVTKLGKRTTLPVEVATFGWETVLDRLSAIGCAPRLRLSGTKPFETDGGNYIADCSIDDIADASGLERQLASIVGVVESGLFVGIASIAIVGTATGVDILRR
jgi:ribose 5-phosphate isomerase A